MKNSFRCPLHSKEKVIRVCTFEGCPNRIICADCLISNPKHNQEHNPFFVDFMSLPDYFRRSLVDKKPFIEAMKPNLLAFKNEGEQRGSDLMFKTDFVKDEFTKFVQNIFGKFFRRIQDEVTQRVLAKLDFFLSQANVAKTQMNEIIKNFSVSRTEKVLSEMIEAPTLGSFDEKFDSCLKKTTHFNPILLTEQFGHFETQFNLIESSLRGIQIGPSIRKLEKELIETVEAKMSLIELEYLEQLTHRYNGVTDRLVSTTHAHLHFTNDAKLDLEKVYHHDGIDGVTCMTSYFNNLVIGTKTGRIEIYSHKALIQKSVVPLFSDPVSLLESYQANSRDRRTNYVIAASTGAQSQVTVYDPEMNLKVFDFNSSLGSVTSCFGLSNGKYIVFADAMGKVCLWDMEVKKEIASLLLGGERPVADFPVIKKAAENLILFGNSKKELKLIQISPEEKSNKLKVIKSFSSGLFIHPIVNIFCSATTPDYCIVKFFNGSFKLINYKTEEVVKDIQSRKLGDILLIEQANQKDFLFTMISTGDFAESIERISEKTLTLAYTDPRYELGSRPRAVFIDTDEGLNKIAFVSKMQQFAVYKFSLN